MSVQVGEMDYGRHVVIEGFGDASLAYGGFTGLIRWGGRRRRARVVSVTLTRDEVADLRDILNRTLQGRAAGL